jgi:hypothetical protein
MTGNSASKPLRKPVREIFLIPAVLAVLGGAGLIFALVGDGVWDGLSWVTLSIPILIFAICLWRGKL